MILQILPVLSGNFQENDSSLLEIQTKSEFRFDAIKKMLLTARWIFRSFPLTTLIRLYELLKNSRESCDSFVNRCIDQHQSRLNEAALMLRYGGG